MPRPYSTPTCPAHLCVPCAPNIITDGPPLSLDEDLHTALVFNTTTNQTNGGRGFSALYKERGERGVTI